MAKRIVKQPQENKDMNPEITNNHKNGNIDDSDIMDGAEIDAKGNEIVAPFSDAPWEIIGNEVMAIEKDPEAGPFDPGRPVTVAKLDKLGRGSEVPRNRATIRSNARLIAKAPEIYPILVGLSELLKSSDIRLPDHLAKKLEVYFRHIERIRKQVERGVTGDTRV